MAKRKLITLAVAKQACRVDDDAYITSLIVAARSKVEELFQLKIRCGQSSESTPSGTSISVRP
jgi:hypothetical protein